MVLSILKINILYDTKIIWKYFKTFHKGIQIFPVLEELHSLWSNVAYMQHCCIFATRDHKVYKILLYPSRSHVQYMLQCCSLSTIYWRQIKGSIPMVLAQKQIISIPKLNLTLLILRSVHKGLMCVFITYSTLMSSKSN